MASLKMESRAFAKVVPKTHIWTGAKAIAHAVAIADVDVIAAYPIRPYTGIMNELATMIADGSFEAEFVVADSEHSQFEIAKHASAIGARTFVGSSGTGMIYGCEPIVVTALGQLPVVAVAGCRTLDDPGNFGMEWNDTLMFRDTGWLVSWAKDPQEALDMTLVAYRVAEDRRVLLPHFVAIDGAAVTHVSSSVEPVAQERATEFLPPYKPKYPLDPSYGSVTKAQHVAPSLIGPEQRKLIDVAMKAAKQVIPEAWNDYAKYVGRRYSPFVETTYMDDAKIALVTMGAYVKDAEVAASKLRKEGVKVGIVRLRYWRPFPDEELKRVLDGVKVVGVLDFSYSFGSPDSAGAFFNEIRAALYGTSSSPPAIDFMFVGGREPSPEHFEKAIRILQEVVQTGKVKKRVWWLTLRGEDI